eukprot:TRINITY_DN1607_c1_g1_i2.p1 TRINITY_DN1607_c1_g1~~TRINITY_DN1607_c1_g1_i2.p1  ORF type:complete len:185 (+),score=29.01 TRINITY_DN1607_c1_g1_i2:103-657(+)
MKRQQLSYESKPLGETEFVEEESKQRKKRKHMDSYTDNKEVIDRNMIGPILYEPGMPLPELTSNIGGYVEVHILAKHLTKESAQVRNVHQWGTSKFSDDSDVVAVLQQSGRYMLHDTVPADRAGVKAVFKIYEDHTDATDSKGKRTWLEVDRVSTLDKFPSPSAENSSKKRKIERKESSENSDV